MRKRFAVAALACCGVSAVVATSSMAATEFGDACIANSTKAPAPVTYFEISAPANPLQQAAPVSGVLTGWRSNLVEGVPFGIPTTLKVIRPNLGAKTAQVIGEGSGGVTSGANFFPVRIPIQAGDRLGIASGGSFGALYCGGAPPSTIGTILSLPPGAGSTGFGEASENLRVPLVGLIEPDVDNDGYGDETQDGCPQSAAYHTPCPVITIDSINLVGKSAVTALVTTSLTAPVTVSGSVKLGKGGTTQLKGVLQTVAPGQFIRFKLNFTSKLKKRLKELPPKKKLTLELTASAANLAGPASADKSSVKLKGQG